MRWDQVRACTLLRAPAKQFFVFLFWFAFALVFVASVHGLAIQSLQAQGGIPSKDGPSAAPTSLPPRSWASEVVKTELDVLNHKGPYLRYRMHVVDAKGDQVRDVIESEDGTVARLILRNGKPLTEEQDRAERQRLDALVRSPSDYYKHVKNENSGKKIADSLMRLMPDAMIYTYTPGQPQTGRNPGMNEIVFDYEPNPKFNPPTTASEALKGLKGRVWIDEKSKHVVRMEGTIFQGVNFAWGMLAHIYPGGKLVLDQVQAGNGRWIYNHFSEQIAVRALMVKTLNINTTVDATDYQIVPAMRYQDAVKILLDTPLPTH